MKQDVFSTSLNGYNYNRRSMMSDMLLDLNALSLQQNQEPKPKPSTSIDKIVAQSTVRSIFASNESVKALEVSIGLLKKNELAVGKYVVALERVVKANKTLKKYKYAGTPLPNLAKNANGGVGNFVNFVRSTKFPHQIN
tara:strand:- start:1160 stop:1576 length:417 start_codon:yes stop_codon:yes gene_type:complete